MLSGVKCEETEILTTCTGLSFLNSHLPLVGTRRWQLINSLKIALLTQRVKSFALKRLFGQALGMAI